MLSLDKSKFLVLQVRNMHVAQPSCFEVTFSLSCKLSLLALKLQNTTLHCFSVMQLLLLLGLS